MQKESQLSEILLSIIQEGTENQLWIGASPPFSMPSFQIRNCTNFRGSPELHGKHSVVWLYEENLDSFRWDQHLFVLDEAIRCLGESGKLVVRYVRHGDRSSVISVKHMVGRRYGVKCRILFEQTNQNEMVTIFDIQRQNLEIYHNKKWTFALLTEGTKIDNVCQFLKSVRDQDPQNQHQILICGPKSEAYARYLVDYHFGDYSTVHGEISRKKNDIAQLAKHPNLLIVHDRYRLDPNFFSGFEKFGYDWDYVTIYQQFEDGKEYPFWCALSKKENHLVWLPPIHLKDYSRLHDLLFLNGGLLIFKTQTLNNIRFNPLLFWHQAEDVELSHRFISHQIPPRVNLYSSATTINTPQDKILSVYVPERPDDAEDLHYDVREKRASKVTPKLSPKDQIRILLQKWKHRIARRWKMLAFFFAIVLLTLNLTTILLILILGIR